MLNITHKNIAQHSGGGQSLGYLRDTQLFFNLSDEEIARFRDASQTRSYKKHNVLYLQEEPAECFYVIYSGWVKLFRTTLEGDEVVVDMLTTGDMFGENAIFDQGRHVCTAQVVEDVRLLSIPSKLLRDQIRWSPTLALGMITSMSLQHSRHHHGTSTLNAMQSAPQRIGGFLLRLCPGGKDKDIAFHLPYDKTLIADTLGMDIATFSRALNILRQKTGIRIRDTRVEIDSLRPLLKFVYGPLAEKYLAARQADATAATNISHVESHRSPYLLM